MYLKHPDLIRAFREAAPDQLSQPFEQAAERVRQVRHRHRVMWGTVAGSIMAVALGLWFGADLLVEMAVSRIPVEWEQKLGEAAYKDFLSHQDVMKEGPAVKAVEEMTQRLAEQIPNNRYKFQVTVVKSDVVNAFALPGGYVVVFTGLMKKADSGEEVAGVLGHELNHVLQRHGMERIVKNLGVMAVVAIIVGDQQGLIGLMRQVGVELLTLKFDRAQEMEADLTGLQLVYRAKIDPNGMITFFQKLSEKDEGRLEWLSTHPMSSARADRLKAELAALPKRAPEPFTFEWKTVQDALGVQPVRPRERRSVARIGVIADTHGLFDPSLIEHFAGVTAILHAGDIGDSDVIRQLQQIAPVFAVSGNVDDFEQSGFPACACPSRWSHHCDKAYPVRAWTPHG